MSQHDLIYLTARDPIYQEMAVVCLRTLRGKGRFTGEIQVFSHEPIDALKRACAETQTHLVPDAYQGHWRMDHIWALSAIARSDYRTILACDADTIATQDIEPVLDTSAGVRFVEERWQTYERCEDREEDHIFAQYFTDQERQDWALLHPINLGHLALPGHLKDTVYGAWHGFVHDPDIRGTEQSALNTAIRRGALGPCKPWHMEVVVTRAHGHRGLAMAPLWHFSGVGESLQERLDYMRVKAL